MGKQEVGRENFDSQYIRYLDKCIEKENGRCEVNVPCLAYADYRNHFIEYKDDCSLYGREDKLQGLEQIIENQGGDCEDLALLRAAEVRYAIKQCGSRDIIYKTCELTDEEVNFDIVEPMVITHCQTIEALEGYDEVSVVCFGDQNPLDEDYNGHCQVMLHKKEVDRERIKENLGRGVLLEATEWMSFDGFMQDDGQVLVCPDECGKDACESCEYVDKMPDIYQYENPGDNYHIYYIISKDNMYIYSYTEAWQWEDYQSFKKELLHYKYSTLDAKLLARASND